MTLEHEKQAGSPRATLRFHPDHAYPDSPTPLHVERLYGLLGRELPLAELSRTLRGYVREQRAPVVGAHHVTCSDEAEREGAEAFHRDFVHYLLPQQKLSRKAAFRSANLGGRYEWGSVRIAEDHYALAKGAEKWKILVVKVNAHVCAEETPEGARFGRMQRYEGDSTFCGALQALLLGAQQPFSEDLEQLFGLEGVDRLGTLRNPAVVPPEVRPLFAAAVSARLQARRAMMDLQDHTPATPTLYLVLPCISVNRQDHDTEILCGIYAADRRGPEPHDEYCGLGDRPEAYRLKTDGGALLLEDDEVHRPRRARDHRELVLATWRARTGTAPRRNDAVARQLEGAMKHPLTSAALGSAIALAAEVAPIPAALLLFGEGVVGIHHAAQAHRLAREADQDEVAQEMLCDVRERIDRLTPEQAGHLVNLMAREYAG